MNLLPQNKIDSEALKAIESFHPSIVKEVQDAIAKNRVVVIGMAQNPVCKMARKALDAANIPFTYLEYGSYFSEWKRRLAIKLWSHWPTFPQVFVDGVLIGGNAELKKKLDAGQLKRN